MRGLLELVILCTQCGFTVATESFNFLSDTLIRKGQVQSVLERRYPCEVSTTGNTLCDYETVDKLYGHLHELVSTPFFKYFQVDLYRECPFWEENSVCKNHECSITTVDESEIPEKWRAAALSAIELDPSVQRTELPGCYYRDSDFCFLDDLTEGDYFDLSLVPERYTGYSGPSAHHVWNSIYEENCFGVTERNLYPTLHDTSSQEECLEKKTYYKIISGLHSSISTHICHDYLNQTTGEWGPNLECFITRVASHPERLEFNYFNTVLLLRAVARLGPYLSAYDYCSTGTHEDHEATLDKMGNIIGIAEQLGNFDETVLFRGENANIYKEEFKSHFRNVTRILDCVGCDKCRLWGKVQTTGVATALKVLFELDEKALDPRSNANLLQRSEVVALLNTLHRFTESLRAVEDFRLLWGQTDAADSERLIRDAELSAMGQRHENFTDSVQRRLFFILDYVRDVCNRGLRVCGSLFTPSMSRTHLTAEL